MEKETFSQKKADMICRAAAIAALAALALSLASILMLAPRALPAYDDFVYGAPIHYTLEAHKGFFDVVRAIWDTVCYTYMDWQGTFSSVLLFSVQPGAFSDDLYGLTACVMLAAVIAPVFLALGTVPGMDRWGRLFLGGVIAFYTVQYLPSPAEGYYWWNGACHYLAFWSLAVFSVVWQIRLNRTEPGSAGFYRRAVFGCFLSFFVGGGNYCTALVLPVVLLGLTGWLLLRRRPRATVTANGLCALFALLGLLINAAAPGNAVRQAGFEKLTPIAAILSSFSHAGEALLHMLDWKLAGALILCTAVFLYAMRKSNCQFSWPPVVLLGSFCLLAALYTPPLYALGSSGMDSRLRNLFWCASVFFVFGNAFYLAGWAARKLDLFRRKNARRAIVVTFAAGALLFSAAVLTQFRSSNAYQAYHDLRNPELENYTRERSERNAVYEDKSVISPRFVPLAAALDSFVCTRIVTWTSDLLVDGVPADLLSYRGRGGAVNYVELRAALDFFHAPGAAAPSDFPVCYHFRGGDYVPLRQLCDLLGYRIDYDPYCDTMLITTAGQEPAR